MRQVVLNLLSNSIKFTFKGSITMKAKGVRKGQEEWIKISVSDTGIGIKQKDQKKLFKEFNMLEESLSLNPSGKNE